MIKARHKKDKFSNQIALAAIIALVIVVLGGAILLFEKSRPAQNPSASSTVPLSAAEIGEEHFLTDMTAHHQEAIDSSQLILTTTNNDEVKNLAQSIIAAQTSEIGQMNFWKARFFPNSTYTAVYMKMMPDLSLYNTSAQKDKAYLTGMIGHHQMAVMMAQQVLTISPHSQTIVIANAIIASQNKEIEVMKRLLSEY